MRRRWDPDEDDDDLAGTGPGPGWPQLGTIAPALARPAGPSDGRPVPGLLNVTVPWLTWPASPSTPGLLGRIGPIAATQARHLAAAAECDPDAQWRIIVTNPAGQAIAVPASAAAPAPARVTWPGTAPAATARREPGWPATSP